MDSLLPLPTEADPRWQSVLARDESQRDAFVFSVASTGIYCRCGCKARTPKPENVRFHADPAAAERLGFRACLRCRPTEPSRAAREAALVADACRRIAAAETPLALDELAEAAGLSPHHFHRLFRRVSGVTPQAYAAALRGERVRTALADGGSVTEALYEAGFNAPSRFYESAPGLLGMAPATFAKGGAGEAIRFAVGPCSLGLVLVAATARGLCAIQLGDDPAAMEAELRRRFPKATIRPAEADFAATVAAVAALADRPASSFDLPLDVAGTAFQRRVWEALRTIPAGETWTYAELAQRIGAPKAVRAVGAACGANKLSLAIPCHRVVGSDGSLTGFAWGVERKRALLAAERAAERAD